jgi:hypothetical protein
MLYMRVLILLYTCPYTATQTFVDTIRQELREAFERVKEARDSDGDGNESRFEEAFAHFSDKSAQMAQLVVRSGTNPEP